MSSRIAHNARWVIVSVNKPVMLRKSDDETWLLNPRRRYVLNADILEDLEDHIDTMSDLQASTHYRPLHSAPRVRLPHSTLLIERYRDRGIGDLLFTTGPLAYLNHITGGEVKPYLYAYGERGAVLNQCPFLADNNPLVGPIHYDDLPLYDHHWFVDTVTEYCEEPDQLNVYDALFRSLGIDPQHVEAKFKRPTAVLAQNEQKTIDDFFFWIFQNSDTHLDLRKTGYYVIAPFANSSLRSAKYETWLKVIRELSTKRPVIVVGVLRERMPTTDMAPGDFVNIIESEHMRASTDGRVISLFNKTSVRNLMQVISRANCVGSMDSAALYIAQAFRTPCVSLWGSHDPAVRIGYDKDYMDLAVWHQRACTYSPCYAWQSFPDGKCPEGSRQRICQCLAFIDENEILKRFEAVESAAPKLIKPALPLATTTA
jgi:Glycosyltransferase family 9 (heptosyltransferase)